MTGFSSCPTSPADAGMLATLHAESFGDEKWSLEQIRGSLSLGTTQGWVARQDATPTGFLLCQIVYGEIEILTLCVNPAHRRQGIAKKLLEQMMETVRKNGNAKIFLEVAADNHAAKNLYEALGFTATGTRAGYYKRGAVTVDGIMYSFANA